MKIHEYQAKELFSSAGIPIPPGKVATSVAAAEAYAKELGCPVVIKAQVHVGGRGKAGGIRFAKTLEAAKQEATHVLGMTLKGLPVKKVLVQKAADIALETYAGIIMDRGSQAPVIMVSAAGGIDIEEVAKTTPEKITKLKIDPLLGLQNFQAAALAKQLFQDPNHRKQAAAILQKLYQVFIQYDCSLAEINPLIATPDGQVLALDAKINFDDNGLFRQPEAVVLRDLDAEAPAETEARVAGLSYIKLDGQIGCLVNGAGLAMATMDVIQHFGGRPANFLDIGGGAKQDQVEKALKIITEDPNVKVILFNIFGGITRCDEVAKGIVAAFQKLSIRHPAVFRLTGTNEETGRDLLKEQGFQVEKTMREACQKAVELLT